MLAQEVKLLCLNEQNCLYEFLHSTEQFSIRILRLRAFEQLQLSAVYLAGLTFQTVQFVIYKEFPQRISKWLGL